MWSDREAEHDCLGFESYLGTLADACVEPELAPLTLGIYGSWGSGKTSLMKMLMRRVEASAAENNAKTLWFNAWRYEGKEEAQSALIHAVLRKLSEDKTLVDDAKDTLKRLKEGASVLKLAKFIGKTAITLTPDIGGFLECFREESEKVAETMERFERDFEKLLEQAEIHRIVVFIDDLDRCQSEKVIETFETIKLFLNIPECTFVIGADADKIEQAIAVTYRVGDQDLESFSRDYLEKIIQLPFRIPEQNLNDIRCYVGMLILKQYLDPRGWEQLLADRMALAEKREGFAEELARWATEHKELLRGENAEPAISQIGCVLPHVDVLAMGLRGNPRQIKRFLNILTLRQRLAAANNLDIDPNDLIKLTVLEYAWRDFFMNLIDTLDPVTGQSPLLGSLVKLASAKQQEIEDIHSPILKAALDSPGLVQFVASEPGIDADLDLTPYAYLAQTALTRQRGPGLTPLDETARSLAGRIANEDRIRSDAAARQAAKHEDTVAAATIRALTPKLITANDARLQTHIITGLDVICCVHKHRYQDAVDAVAQSRFAARGAAGLAASTLVANAEKEGVEIPASLRERLESASGVTKTLASAKAKTRRKGS